MDKVVGRVPTKLVQIYLAGFAKKQGFSRLVKEKKNLLRYLEEVVHVVD